MHVVTLVLVLLLAVAVSTITVRLLPLKVPLPLLQIAIGAALAGAGFEVAFDSQLFLLLFIPPLLFLDGWRIPKGALFREWRPVLALAIGLVVFTVVGIGYFVHWLIPAVPLAMAFALAAILSPTDPVAVGAMTASAPLPSRLMHILEGESLLNDATGLVCFSFAVTAALTGRFSLPSAALGFLMVVGGGVLVGLAVTWLIGGLNRLLVRRAGEEPAPQILISLLIPFAAYLAAQHLRVSSILAAQHLHVSGILAAAVAGIAMHYSELAGRPLAVTRMQRNAVWNTLQIALNGIIFVLLGEQLPHMLSRLREVAAASGVGSAWHLIGYAVAITLALGTLRLAWVWISIRLTILRAASHGESKPVPTTRLLAITATAGVRGAVTLAGILTLPMLLADGAAFPARDLLIFLAMGVILLSLLIASVGLPLLTRGLPAELPQEAQGKGKANARLAAAEAAMRRIEQIAAEPESNAKAAAARDVAAMHVLETYRWRLDYGESAGEDAADARRQAAAERRLRLQALAAERDELDRLRRAGSIDDDVHRQLVYEIDLMEARLLTEAAH